MKISILTHWWSHENYGQMLQAYALQTHLENIGHQVTQTRYCGRLTGWRLVFKRLSPFHILRAIKNRFFTKKHNPHERERNFPEFKQNYLHLSKEEYFNHEQLLLNPPQADVYIVGSDQVWNELECNSFAKPWFLDFGPSHIKRIAYAASFGKANISDNLLRFIRPLLHNLDAISVREKSGVNICKKADYNEVTHVVDPTLLLEAEDYAKISNLHSKPRSGVMGYFLGANMDIPWQDIMDYTHQGKKLKITEISGAIDYLPPNLSYYYPTIQEWLQDISNSEMMITNSFHGTVFAILFNTPFICFLRSDKSAEINERIHSLLTMLNLSDRIYSGKPGSFYNLVEKKINWNEVRADLVQLRSHSKKFLNHNLTEA